MLLIDREQFTKSFLNISLFNPSGAIFTTDNNCCKHVSTIKISSHIRMRVRMDPELRDFLFVTVIYHESVEKMATDVKKRDEDENVAKKN